MGLRLDVQPYWLIKVMINENSQKILDEIIITQFKKLLKDFNEWQIGVIESMEDGEDPDVVWVKHHRDVHIQQIQDVADFSRNLLDLHSDWEAEITEDEERIISMAYQYWKYNGFYGHEKI